MSMMEHTQQELTAGEQLDDKQRKKLKRHKKLKYGSMATAVTAIVIVVVILINVLVSMLTSFRFDLTSDQLYEVSEDTIDYVKNLDQDVEIAISLDEDTLESLFGTTAMMITETLSKYEGYSDHLSVTYFDTTKDPDILSKYQQLYGGDIGSGYVIVSNGTRCKVYSLMELFDIDSSMYYYYMYGQCSFSEIITGYKGEQVLTNAIMNVTDSNVKRVGMIEQSNGDYIYSATQGNANAMESLANLLDDNGYDVERSLDIATADLNPDDYDILVLPAPVSDLSVDAIERLTDFLHNDGNLGKQLLYIADYTQGDTPNLDAFLKDWNIEIGNSVINDSDSNSQVVNTYDVYYSRGQSMLAPSVTIATDDYSDSLENTSLPIVAPFARPITEVTANNGRVVIPLWQTSASSYEVSLDSSVTLDSNDTSAHTVACIVTNQISSNNELIESDLLVLSSLSMLDALIVSDSAYNNGEYVISALNTLCNKEASNVIASKSLTASTLDITADQIDVIKWIVWVVFPLAAIVGGVAVSVRRRRR
jgi:hypothetical protein